MTKNAEYFKITVATGAYTRSYFTDADCKIAGTTGSEAIDFTATSTSWKKSVDAKYTKEVAFTAEAKTACPNKDKKIAGVYNNGVCYKFASAYKKAVIIEDAGVKKWTLAVYNDAACTDQTSTPSKVECNKCTNDVYTACYESESPVVPDSSAINFILLALAIFAFLF
ncbi:hypothetical protein EIN_482630 [Entamoeba invadens IP1]|uniref:Uncharacterized protein n=1 Tax=Entamoeba invadens IP1 TaxID=370355 RepID=A0A0A1UAI8_ENTIV|nr:hypothetical protein EIN_482630 [Entamoeba invadens IP1]ELP90199.1 hypothetical protein EIN_482630 [Entamoeba invadens IP1]|eukprot:XP_004256970.1 hypothetical protein EIN_482630 [Entamoeba invadens IP1]